MDAGACQTVVLHVDDDATSRAFVRQVLALRDGVTLVEAASGNEGLVAAREHEPALILLDFHLPDVNGDEVLRQLRSDPSTSSTAVVFISAAARPADLADVLADGDGYLRKPFGVEALLAYVDASLAVSHAQGQDLRSRRS
jgi:CheY-like chemotaxis protein